MSKQLFDNDFRNLVEKFLEYDIKFLKKFNLDKLSQYKENEKKYYKYVSEVFPIAEKAKKCLNQILLELSYYNNVIIMNEDKDPILDFIKNLRSGKKILSIVFYDIFENVGFPDKSEDNGYSSEWWHQCEDVLFAKILPEDYVKAKIELLAVIKMRRIPEKFNTYFNQIVDSYAFGIPLAYTAICRAVLEMCISDLLNSNKEYNLYLKDIYGKVPCFSDRIDLAYEYNILNSKMKDLAHKIRLDANKVLHISGSNTTEKKIIGNIVTIIEYLYS